MPRLIDANQIIAPDAKGTAWEGGEYWAYMCGIDSVMEKINSIPTVDAVLVVRCKDCKYRTKDTKFTRAGYCGRRGAGDFFVALPDGFCSYGERRGKKRKIKAYLDTGFAGCQIEEEFEVEDEATDAQIEEMAKEAVFDHIDWGWYEVKENV